MKKHILDVCCGGKMFYTNKKDSRVLFMDIRTQPLERLSNGAMFEVAPDVVGDFTDMPFDNNAFPLVIFDPPHCKCGKKSFICKKYGSLGRDWEKILRKGFDECFRVLRPSGTLIFKWSDSYKSLKEILKLAPIPPLITHTANSSTGKSKTYFCIFYKDFVTMYKNLESEEDRYTREFEETVRKRYFEFFGKKNENK